MVRTDVIAIFIWLVTEHIFEDEFILYYHAV